MSAYSDSVSRPGRKSNAGTDPRELFMVDFGDMTLEAWEQTFDFANGKTFVKNISSGKADTFPIIGRKRDGVDHIPGEVILGGGVEHNEVEISVDNMTVDAVFIAEIDELLLHYELARPYAKQLGESLASVSNGRIGRSLVLAGRTTDAPYEGGPVPGYSFHADMATDPSKLEDAAFDGIEYIRVNDVGGGQPDFWLPWKQQLLLARYTGIDTEATSGAGNRSAGTVGPMAGLSIRGTNSIPNTNYTADSFAKYNGDFTPTVGVIANGMAVGTLKRRGMKVTMSQKDDRLGTLLIASQLEGHGALRRECSYEVRKTAR